MNVPKLLNPPWELQSHFSGHRGWAERQGNLLPGIIGPLMEVSKCWPALTLLQNKPSIVAIA